MKKRSTSRPCEFPARFHAHAGCFAELLRNKRAGQINITSIEDSFMSMQTTIKSELPLAIKSRDVAKTEAVRIIIGEFQRQPAKELSDEQVIAIIKKLVKSEKELLASSGKESSAYLAILEGYLPQSASEDEIRAWIEANIDFSTFKNKMQAMRPIMAHFGAAADGNTVSRILQSL
jgi:uncharacterized protein YqeY